MNNVDKDLKITPNITGVIDLLGFESYLDMGQHDLRTSAGGLAIERLKILKDAISKMNQEKSKHPELYPPNFFIKQITDSIIISADIDDVFLPAVGRRFEGGFGYKDLIKLYGNEPDKNEQTINYANKVTKESGFIIGAIARVHQFVNNKEFEMFFPGCRTTITSGVRVPFENEEGTEDMLSKNFAFASAWKSNDKGSENNNMKGPNLFLENSAAFTLLEGTLCQKILRLSKFEEEQQGPDPYRITWQGPIGIFMRYSNKINENEPFKIVIGRLNLTFRKVNPIPLSMLQFIPNLSIWGIEEDKTIKKHLAALESSDEEILNLKGVKSQLEKFDGILPLRFIFGLDDDIDELIKAIKRSDKYTINLDE